MKIDYDRILMTPSVNMTMKTSLATSGLDQHLTQTRRSSRKPYLNFIEEFSVEKGELISNLMATEVMESSRSVKTHKLLEEVFNFLQNFIVTDGKQPPK